MKEEWIKMDGKSAEEGWYVFGFMNGDEKELVEISWEYEEDARSYARDLFNRACFSGCKSFYSRIELGDITVFDGSWSIIKKGEDNNE